jgi:2-polyprenyl-3-methyl-5-hydroxy-6-metoxy-1,4-benzoquinol methylase
MKDEISRIRHIYNTQYRNISNDYSYIWHARNPVSITFRHSQERAIVSLLNQNNIQLEEISVLDVGCGYGGLLRFLATLGAAPKNLFGIDLMEYRIEYAQSLSPADIHFSIGDAQSLSFADSRFDMLCSFTIFSSILDETVQNNVAKEMNRVNRHRPLDTIS